MNSFVPNWLKRNFRDNKYSAKRRKHAVKRAFRKCASEILEERRLLYAYAITEVAGQAYTIADGNGFFHNIPYSFDQSHLKHDIDGFYLEVSIRNESTDGETFDGFYASTYESTEDVTINGVGPYDFEYYGQGYTIVDVDESYDLRLYFDPNVAQTVSVTFVVVPDRAVDILNAFSFDYVPVPYTADLKVLKSIEQDFGQVSENLNPDPCSCSCSCDEGTADSVTVTTGNRGNLILRAKIYLDGTQDYDDTLRVVSSVGQVSDSQDIKLVDVDERSDYFTDDIGGYLLITVELDGGTLPDGSIQDYEITLMSLEGLLIDGPKIIEGRVAIPAAGTSIGAQPEFVVDSSTAAMSINGKLYEWDKSGSVFEPRLGNFAQLEDISGEFKVTTDRGHAFFFDSSFRLTSRTQADGRTTTYGYTTIGGASKLTSISDWNDVITLSYTDGLMTQVSHSNGWLMDLNYDGNGRLHTITRPDPDGAGPLSNPVVTYGYSGSDKIASITRPGGLVTQYTYDTVGRLASITEPTGSVVTFVSAVKTLTESFQAVATITDSRGIVTTLEYDDWGRISRRVDGEGLETIYDYGQFGIAGNQTVGWSELGSNGLLSKLIHPDPDGAGPLESPVYEYTYDSRGNMLTETLPDDSVSTWVYHSTYNEPVQYTDANGNVTLYTYDVTHEWLLSETQVVGEIDDAINLETDDLTTTYTYTAAPTTTGDPPIGLIASMTAPDGVVTEYEYDEDGNRTKTIYAVGTADEAFTTSTYDAAGNMLTFTDEMGNTTTYTYDNLSRVTSVTYADPDGAGPLAATVENYTYNAMGLVATESINGRTTTYEYDSSGRLETVTEADPDTAGPLTVPETSYTYDTNGNLLTITDPLGNVTTYAYTDGLLISITEADPDDAGPQSAPVTSYTYDDAGRILTATDPLGQVTTYTYDNLGRQISVSLPDPDGAGALTSLSSTTVYDAFGRIVSETDFQGITTTYTYDSESNLLTETTPLGTTTYTYDDLNRLVEVETADPDGAGALAALVTTYSYTASGQIASVTTPKGTTSYTYDNRRRRTSVTLPDPDGAGGQSAPVSSTTYDDAGNLLAETDALGNVTAYEYDDLNRVIKIISPDPDGVGPLTSPLTEYAYDEFGQLVGMTDPNGGVTAYEYDDLGRKTKIIYADPDGAGVQTSPEVLYAYDANSQLTSMTDELGNVTTYEYDNLGRKISVTLPDPDGAGPATSPAYSYQYDANGQLLSETDPLGRTTSYTYDAMGRLLTETLPDPDGIAPAGPLAAPVTTYAYNNSGQLASVTDAESQTVSYTYNVAGLVATMTDPRGTTTYIYDALGRQVSITEPDPDGAGPQSAPVTTFTYDNEGDMVAETTLDGTTSYEYDDLGRLVKVTMPDPDGAGSEVSPWTVYTYDLLGRTLSETDRLGHVTSYDYDNLGRLFKIIDAEGGETEYTYDANGKRLTLTDPEENTTTWTYDALNRMLTNTNELSDTRSYEYDAAGNVVGYTDRNGRVTVYEYDNLQRRTAEKWMDGVSVVRTLSYTYDAASQLTSASDPAATYTFTYDNLGRNTSTEHDLAALGFDVVIDEAYDQLGRRISLATEIDGTDDFENTYAYDYLNRMTQVTQGSQSGGNTVAEKRVDFAYDAEDSGQFTSVTRYADLAGTELVATSTYDYDAADHITGLTHADGSSSTLAGYTWAYDEGNRLTAFTVYGYSAEDADYSYDDTDQLTGADRSGTSDDEAYTYDANGNRTNAGYSTDTNNQLLSDGTYNYTYDAEGNRLTKTNISTGDYTVYEYDYRDRLVRVTDYDSSDVKQQKVEYAYDIHNLLIGRKLDSNGDGTFDTTGHFVYDGNQILFVLDGSGNVDHRLLWGDNVDQLLADENASGDVYWALTDHLSTVRDWAEYDDVNDTTSIVNHIAYDGFGNVLSETNSSLDGADFGYTARYFDEATGLQYNTNRWYDATTGRWISQDPIEFEAGDENLYRYVSNSPVRYSDPSGLEWYTPAILPTAPTWNFGGDRERIIGERAPIEDYIFYATNPSWMDDDLETGYYVSGGTGAAAGTAAAVIVASPALIAALPAAATTVNEASIAGYIIATGTQGQNVIVIGGTALAAMDFQGRYYQYDGDYSRVADSYWNEAQAHPEYSFFAMEQAVFTQFSHRVNRYKSNQYKTCTDGLVEAVEESQLFAPNNSGGWIRRPEGTRLKQVGNYWIKEVDPDASAIQRWWGRGSLNAQARALEKLGDMAPSHLFKNGRLVMRDAGTFSGSTGDFWRIWAKGSCRMGTPFNDIRPRNIGSAGQIFDPAFHPIQEGVYWTGAGVVVAGGGTWVYYEFQSNE